MKTTRDNPQFWCAACDEIPVKRWRDCCDRCNREKRPARAIVTTKRYERLRPRGTPANRHELDHAPADAPYERAVRSVERRTGKPRSEWEHRLNSPYVLAANVLAARYAEEDLTARIIARCHRPAVHRPTPAP